MCPLRDLLIVETNFNTIKIPPTEYLLPWTSSVNCTGVDSFPDFLIYTEGVTQPVKDLEVITTLKITALDTTSTKGSCFYRIGQFRRRSSHIGRNWAQWQKEVLGFSSLSSSINAHHGPSVFYISLDRVTNVFTAFQLSLFLILLSVLPSAQEISQVFSMLLCKTSFIYFLWVWPRMLRNVWSANEWGLCFYVCLILLYKDQKHKARANHSINSQAQQTPVSGRWSVCVCVCIQVSHVFCSPTVFMSAQCNYWNSPKVSHGRNCI